jgi:methionyl-tRNA formyltransferase
VACGEGCLELTSVQRPGGRPMPAEAFLRGFPMPVGTRLGRPCPATS